MVFKIIAIIVLSCAFANADPGSSSTVGGGGTGVICKVNGNWSKPELFDLVEKRISGRASQINLGDESLSVDKKVLIGLSRIDQFAPKLNRYLARLIQASEQYQKWGFDPWESNLALFDYYLQPFLETEDETLRELKEEKCKVVILAIHPNDNDGYRSLCSNSVAGYDNCLLVNKAYLREMTNDQKACLFIHEALRNVSELHSEIELRQLTSQLCTGRY